VQLEHRFTVPAPIEVAWEVLNDVERVGACFPGASVTSVEGDEFAGTCKVKLGPISMQYSGSGRFVQRDADARRAVIEAKGKDKRGNGTAAVTITTALTSESQEQTTVAVDTDLSITGRPAQFGRGVIQDVSDKLLGQFTECLEARIAPAEEQGAAAESSPAAVSESGSAASAQPAAESPTETPSGAPAGGAGSYAGATAPSPAGSRPSSEPSALDLGSTVVPILVRRYAPYLVGAVVVLLVLRKVLRR
jgi:uncharacterized protein